MVCADGSRSGTRHRLLPEVEPLYAGYVAWRGTIEEEQVAPELVRFFDQSFTFCEARSGGHVLCYFIPGPNAATEPGRRRLNWVWYVNVPAGPRLDRLLTDRNGELHVGSVPAGMVPDELPEKSTRLPHASCTRASSSWSRGPRTRSFRSSSTWRCRA